jgi:surfactin synthase thioesterase subunit
MRPFAGQLHGREAQESKSAGFPSWIRYSPGRPNSSGGATVLFPHAGAAAASYRELASALAAGGDLAVVQYPQRADRFGEPAAETLPGLALELFESAAWLRLAPLRLFGHSMGALVAFEFARIAEERGVAVRKLWASASPAPATVAGSAPLPTDHAGVLADLVELGGTDSRLLADEEFARLLTIPLRSDYQAINRYVCGADVAIGADIDAVGGRGDSRVDPESLRRWERHTTGKFTLSFFDGGHFYVNDRITDLATRMIADG